MAESTTTLRVEGLTAGYGNAEPAVDSATFEIKRGELTAILGANGVGKTTLLHSILGLVPLRAGRIHLDDIDITGMSPRRRVRAGLGLALEGHQVIDRLSVEDNLLLALYPRRRRLGGAGVKKALARAYEMFDVLGARRGSPAGTLSGGQQQMLVVARLFVSDSQVLLLDEPSLGLAPAIAEVVYRKLIEIRDAGQAVVVVEQNAALAEAMSDSMYLLRRGTLLASADEGGAFTREELKRAYLTD